MTDKKGDKLMKFGPEWLRNNLSRDTTLVHGTNTTCGISAKSRTTAKFKPAEHKYKRDDLLSLYRGKEPPPEELTKFKSIYVKNSQTPIGLQFCPRRVRAKRPILPRCDATANVDLKLGNKNWSREHTRPQINYFQPRWLNESNWRENHHLNKGPEGDETWRNAKQEYQKNRWNEKGKDRRDFQRPFSNDPWIDDRQSPDDMLPEWANSEDILDETGTFDSSGAFLPIINNGKLETEENNNVEDDNYSTGNGNSVTENQDDQQDEEIVENEPVLEDENPTKIEPPEPVDNLEVINESDETILDMPNMPNLPQIFKSDMEDTSYSMVEDYLNKLVQEDDLERNRNKFEQNLGPQKFPFPIDPNAPMMGPIPFSMLPPGVVHELLKPTGPSLPIESNGWYYQDHQDIIRGPYSSVEITEYCKAGFLSNFSLVRKGTGPHFILLNRLFDLCGGVLPFLVADHITTNIFHPTPFLPPADPRLIFNENNPNMNHLASANKLSGSVKDFINAASLSMDRLNQQVNNELSKHPIRLSDFFPMNVMPPQRPNVPPVRPFQHDMRIENPLPFDYNQIPFQPPEHGNVMNLQPQLETAPRNDWMPLNPPPSVSWIESTMQPKVSPYVPIPMPISSHTAPNINQEPTSILSHPHDDYLAGLKAAKLSIGPEPPTVPIANTQSVVSSTVTNSPLWNNRVAPTTVETFDYNLSILAQRQKPIYAISPQQPQQFSNVEQQAYTLQEKQIIDEESDPMLSNTESEKSTPDMLMEVVKRKSKDKSSDSKKNEKKLTKSKDIMASLRVMRVELGTKQMLEAHQNQQKKKQPQIFPIQSPPWNMKENNHNIENTHIMNQIKFTENHDSDINSAFVKMQLTPNDVSESISPNIFINPVNVASREKMNNAAMQFTWANSKPLSNANVISFAEIQAQEQLQNAKLEKSASAPRIFHSKSQQKMWNNSSENNHTSIEGFWDTQSNKSKVALSKSSSSNGQAGMAKSLQSLQSPPPKVEKTLKVPVKVVPTVKKETKEKPNIEKNENDALFKFIAWAKNELNAMSDIIDVHDFVNFLRTVESPYEVEEYAKVYLGDTKTSLDFAKLFIQRRSQMLFSKSRSIPCDDLCSPAPAYNPSVDKREDPKNKNKKKKGKMSKVDARILGFNATASENRFNIGNIDVP